MTLRVQNRKCQRVASKAPLARSHDGDDAHDRDFSIEKPEYVRVYQNGEASSHLESHSC